MFTGLIEDVGVVVTAEETERGCRLRVRSALSSALQPGDSLAVNGVCLTATAVDGSLVTADISPETMKATTLGSLSSGGLVNLERPLRADARLGGHFVQGHVDATGLVQSLTREGEFYRLAIEFPGELAPYLVRKGSVAVDGISLTIAGLFTETFDVQIIPFTWEHTNLRSARVRDPVNVECDIVGKYVVRLAELAGSGQPMERLGPGVAGSSQPVP